MKRLISIILLCSFLLSGCTAPISDSIFTETSTMDVNTHNKPYEPLAEIEGTEPTDVFGMALETADKPLADQTLTNPNLDFTVKGLDDVALLHYVENNIYTSLIQQLDSDDYFIENVEAEYFPREYIEALASNSQPTRYFGYTVNELNEQFQGTKYVFTLGADGQTVVVPMETVNDEIYVKALEDVMVGTGVILICVTVSAVTAPVAPAVGMIFAASASSGTAFALESSAISFTAAAIAKGYETESFDQAIKAGVVAASESFKWGAIIGASVGGVQEAFALKGATLNGLSMNEAAKIQKESNWPLEAIKGLHSKAEYEIYKNADLIPQQLPDGTWAFLRQIDWSYVDSMGRTNAQRVAMGLAPEDPTGVSYELHHIGMRADSPLAILTKAEHHAKENYSILHYAEEGKKVPDEIWSSQKKEFWNLIVKMAQGG